MLACMQGVRNLVQDLFRGELSYVTTCQVSSSLLCKAWKWNLTNLLYISSNLRAAHHCIEYTVHAACNSSGTLSV